MVVYQLDSGISASLCARVGIDKRRWHRTAARPIESGSNAADFLGGRCRGGDFCFLASRAYRSANRRLNPVQREAKGGYFGG